MEEIQYRLVKSFPSPFGEGLRVRLIKMYLTKRY
jgi:hypothetical protein